MQPLRPYQLIGTKQVTDHWHQGTRAVCLVIPTGGGKTRCAEELIHQHQGPVLFVAHRRELIRQTALRLQQSLGREQVGIISPGDDPSPHARIQVASVQTLIAREQRPPATLCVWDETHHYRASDWSRVVESYPDARHLGLTATPERADGKPLGDMFQAMVTGASYSQLLADGFLVPCKVYQPPDTLKGLAQDPLKAYQRHANQALTFAFATRVDECETQAARFREAGIPSQVIHANTRKGDRDRLIADLAAGRVRVLWNVSALTEGVDVPEAQCVLLAKQCDHVGQYLQIAGRVLRPHTSKRHAILIDLTGATLRHGLPTTDREYSLDGEGIRQSSGTVPLRQCLACGSVFPARPGACPECGFEPQAGKPREVRIYDAELREVYAGAETPAEAKVREYSRLREVQRSRGFQIWWVVKEYKRLFSEEPVLTDATSEEKRQELERLQTVQQERGYKPGWVGVMYKKTFGHWPERESAA